MTRTKWMRLGVRDPADILRWAGAQNSQQLDAFRYRVIRGREFVSFRMVPRYAIQIGTRDIVVVAHVKHNARQRAAAAITALSRRAVRKIYGAINALQPRPEPVANTTAKLYRLQPARLSLPSRG